MVAWHIHVQVHFCIEAQPSAHWHTAHKQTHSFTRTQYAKHKRNHGKRTMPTKIPKQNREKETNLHRDNNFMFFNNNKKFIPNLVPVKYGRHTGVRRCTMSKCSFACTMNVLLCSVKIVFANGGDSNRD